MKIQAKRSFHSTSTRWPKLKILTTASAPGITVSADGVYVGVNTSKNYWTFSKGEHAPVL